MLSARRRSIKISIESLSPERHESLLFNKGKVGVKFIQLFLQAIEDFTAPQSTSPARRKRFSATEAETLATLVSAERELIEKHNIDAGMICKIEETGGMSGRDCTGNSSWHSR